MFATCEQDLKKAFLTKYKLLGGECTCLLSGLYREVAVHVVGFLPWKRVKVCDNDQLRMSPTLTFR